MENIVTRFAPSPTGYIHLGNVRSAIYPYLIAKQKNGKFILRIEDTDQARYVDGATEMIEDTLRWLGMQWDEGPIVGGEHAPYFQSERRDIYKKWAMRLLSEHRAYLDSTSEEEIQKYRKECEEKKVPFLYRNFRPKDLKFEWQDGVPIRFLADPKHREWKDEVMGDLSAGPEVQDDIILIKKDGLPTYNFAHIVDDAEMNVTHIVRGVEYLSSMPNYLAIYEALGLEIPKFVSLPHVLAPTGNKKLSKRDGAKSVTGYREDGVLPEAMLNYLCCLGWNDGTEQEIYSMDELLKRFSIDRIQNSGARFDEVKLLWYSGQWIRKIADEKGIDELYARTDGFWPEEAKNYDDDYCKKVLSIIYDRLKTLGDLSSMTDYFFVEPDIKMTMLVDNKFTKKMSESERAEILRLVADKLSKVEDWSAEPIQNVLNELLTDTERKPAELFSLIRIALSFAPFSPALNLTLEVLGKDRSISRIRKTVTAILND